MMWQTVVWSLVVIVPFGALVAWVVATGHPRAQDLGNEDSGFDGETDSILSRRRDDETPIP